LNYEDGVSPRTYPGTRGGQYYNNAYEHEETGLVTDDPKVREAMAHKRLKKFAAIKQDIMDPIVYGDSEAELTFVTWGSTTGPVLEAMTQLREKGHKVQVIQFKWLFPFPVEKATSLLSPITKIIDVEQNATSQLAGLIREYTGISIKDTIVKYDGRPLYPEEIIAKCGL